MFGETLKCAPRFIYDLVTVAKCPFTCTNLFHRVTLRDDRDTTLYTLWTTSPVNIAKIFICACMLSLVHVHGSEIRCRNIKHLKHFMGPLRNTGFYGGTTCWVNRVSERSQGV